MYFGMLSNSRVFLFFKAKNITIFSQTLLLGFCIMYFKRFGLGFSNYGFNFKHNFTTLYTPFLRHSILIHKV